RGDRVQADPGGRDEPVAPSGADGEGSVHRGEGADRVPEALLREGRRRDDRHRRGADRGHRPGHPEAHSGCGPGRSGGTPGPRSGAGLAIADCGFRIAESGQRTADCRLRMSEWGVRRMESPRGPGSVYTEKDLQDLWESGRFRREGLLTEEAVPLVVEFPGFRWGEGGPDFRGARLRLGGRPVWGDVEIHLTPSGWAAHGHRRDGAYASVVLHVVLRRDRFVEPPKDPPLLVLEPYLHGTLPPPPAAGSEDLDALGEEWFAERRGRIERALERAPADEVLYREILVGLGYKHNKADDGGVAGARGDRRDAGDGDRGERLPSLSR